MSMTDQLTQTILAALLAGLVGGLVAGIAVTEFFTRFRPTLLQRHIVEVDVQMRAGPVSVPVKVIQPDPVQISVQTAPEPTVAERGLRYLEERPETGPSELSRMLSCSKSTAAQIIEKFKKGERSHDGVTADPTPA